MNLNLQEEVQVSENLESDEKRIQQLEKSIGMLIKESNRQDETLKFLLQQYKPILYWRIIEHLTREKSERDIKLQDCFSNMIRGPLTDHEKNIAGVLVQGEQIEQWPVVKKVFEDISTAEFKALI